MHSFQDIFADYVGVLLAIVIAGDKRSHVLPKISSLIPRVFIF